MLDNGPHRDRLKVGIPLAEIVEWRVRKGEDKDYLFTVRDANGETLNVTGWSARVQIRPSADSDTVLEEWSSPDGVVTSAAGVTVTLTRAGTLDWSFYQAYYGILLTDPGGKAALIAAGKFIADPAVVE
jgi:hypothetical protein